MAIGKDPTYRPGGKAADKDREIVGAVLDLVKECDETTSEIKEQWRQNYRMFVSGSTFQNKAEWMTDFSTMDLPAALRQVQGQLVNILVQNPRWWDLSPRTENNPQAETLRRPLKKLMDYYLEDSKFVRHAGTFILNSLMNIGNLYVGWKFKTIPNPEEVLRQAKEEAQKEQRKLAAHVANPSVADEALDPDHISDSIDKALSGITALATGDSLPEEPKRKPYLQVGALDLQDPIHEQVWWDDSVSYMEDANWKAFEYEIPLWELKRLARLGYLPRSKVDKIKAMPVDTDFARRRREYKALSERKPRKNVVSLLVYQGPLIVNGDVEEDSCYCIIANRSVLLKKTAAIFWEPPGQKTALISAAIRQIPHRPTGAGMGDNAIKIQRTLDSNYQLICDQFRFALPGINVVDRNALVDKGEIDEGLEPGKTYVVRGDVGKAFTHINLSSNIENQVHPINGVLTQALNNATGVNDMMSGAPAPHARTPAAETNARLAAGGRTVNLVALDLELNFLVPALQKIFARVLQFGVPEVTKNPQLQAIFTPDEVVELQALDESDRMDILQNFYKFDIDGFSGLQKRDDTLSHVTDLLGQVNRDPQGPVSQTVDVVKLVKLYTKLHGLEDEDTLLIKNSPIEIINAENVALLAGHQVIPNPQDNDQLHLQYHQGITMSQAATQELMQHIQMHTQQMQQKQMQMQMSAVQGQPQPTAQPPR